MRGNKDRYYWAASGSRLPRRVEERDRFTRERRPRARGGNALAPRPGVPYPAAHRRGPIGSPRTGTTNEGGRSDESDPCGSGRRTRGSPGSGRAGPRSGSGRGSREHQRERSQFHRCLYADRRVQGGHSLHPRHGSGRNRGRGGSGCGRCHRGRSSRLRDAHWKLRRAGRRPGLEAGQGARGRGAECRCGRHAAGHDRALPDP